MKDLDILIKASSELYNKGISHIIKGGKIKVPKNQMMSKVGRTYDMVLSNTITAFAKERKKEFFPDFIVTMFTADVYSRWLDEKTGKENVVDKNLRRVFTIIKASREEIDRQISDRLLGNVTKGLEVYIKRAVKKPFNYEGMLIRITALKTVFRRLPSPKIKAIFQEPRDYKMINKATEASDDDDVMVGAKALQSIIIRTPIFRSMIMKMLATIDNKKPVVTVEEAVEQTTDDTDNLADVIVKKKHADVGTEERENLENQEKEILDSIKKQTNESGEEGDEDKPITKADAVALASQIVAGSKGIKAFATMKQQPDEEQTAAVLTSGKALIAAAAGSGKTKTLVAKVSYLIKDKGVDPSEIFVSTFTKNAATEMKSRIKEEIGDAADNSDMFVGTLHAFSFRMLGKYGSSREREAVKNTQKGGFRFGILPKFAKEEWEQANRKKSKISPKELQLQISKWKYKGVTPDIARQENPEAGGMYAIYETLKGREKITGGEPYYKDSEASRSWSYRKNAAMKSAGRTPIVDFDDMQSDFLKIMQENPNVKKELQQRFKHFIIDECQDCNAVQLNIFHSMTENVDDSGTAWMVGDDSQCVEKQTNVLTPNGDVKVCDLKEGDDVLSYRNGQIKPQKVKHCKKTMWEYGFKINTQSGKELIMSPTHKIWASDIVIKHDMFYVYLMYKRDFGFRVGISKQTNDEGGLKGVLYGNRATQEGADKQWVLCLCKNREEALLNEQYYSLKYGVPTVVFNGENRGLNQNRLNILFEKFGENGNKILKKKNYNFDYPHWMAGGSGKCSSRKTERRVINFIAHSSKVSHVSLEWTGDDLDDITKKYNVKLEKNNRRRLRNWFSNYREALSFAEELKNKTGAFISEKLSTPDGVMRLTTASALYEGMKLVSIDDDQNIFMDRITDIEKVDGIFYDLDIDDASNFFGNGILSHNSIYRFRGAEPEKFVALSEDPKWKLRTIKTNYRCNPQIVDAANSLVNNNKNRIPLEARPNKKGDAGIQFTRSPLENASGDVMDQVKNSVESNLEDDYKDFSVLARTNNELHDFEASCIIRGIPYKRKGGSNFFNRKEVAKTVSYITIATTKDVKAQNKAILDIYNYPMRYLPKQFVSHLERESNGRPYIEVLDDQSFQGLFGRGADNVQNLYNDLTHLIGIGSSGDTNQLISEILETEGPKGKIKDYVMADAKDEEAENEEGNEESYGGITFLLKMAEPDPSDPTLNPSNPNDFLTKIDNYKERSKELKGKRNSVTLSTIHGAKGLQWKNVTAVMAPPMVIPKEGEELSSDEIEKLEEEERRIAYVQITRAEENISVISPAYDQKGRPLPVSKFIKEAGLDIYAKDEELEKGSDTTAPAP